MRLRLATATFAVMALMVVGCSGSSGSDGGAQDDGAPAAAASAGPEAAAAALADDRLVIDVRTQEEFDAGHVDGAELRDVQDPAFDANLDDLDPDGAYVVYCRTGARSAAATERMQTAGFDVVDGGSFDDMVAAGWPAAG